MLEFLTENLDWVLRFVGVILGFFSAELIRWYFKWRDKKYRAKLLGSLDLPLLRGKNLDRYGEILGVKR